MTKKLLQRRKRQSGSGGERTALALRLAAPAVRLGVAASNRASSRVPRPFDDPHGHAPGPSRDRVLLLGAGPAVGWGVASHALALPGTLARALALRTGRGCTVDLVADPRIIAATASDALRDTVLTRYDAVVVILGVNDALRLTSPARWHQHLQALLSELRSGCKPETPIVMTGIQPIRSIPLFDNLTGSVVDVHARHLNEVTEELCRTTPGVTFVPLQGHSHVDPERHRTGAQYSLWAEGIAEAVQSALPPCDLRSPKEVARAAEAESRRQRAVDSLELKYARDSPALEKLAQLAREAFATKWALITVIDGDRQWHLAIAGADFPEVPRSQSFCHTTIQTDGGLVVSDTLQDARFKNNPLVTADPKVRFYAGFPIEAPDGERIGAVCILDSEPRPRDAAWVETDFIEELAVLAQAELWRLQRALHEGDGLVGLETEDDVLDSDAR